MGIVKLQASNRCGFGHRLKITPEIRKINAALANSRVKPSGVVVLVIGIGLVGYRMPHDPIDGGDWVGLRRAQQSERTPVARHYSRNPMPQSGKIFSHRLDYPAVQLP